MKTLTRLISVACCIGSLATLVGCSGLPYAMNPYRYQFDSDRSPTLCLIARNDSSVAMTYEVKKALEEKGFKVREVNEMSATDCVDCVRFDCAFGGWSNASLTRASLELTQTESDKTQIVRVSSSADVPAGLANVNTLEAIDTIRTLVDRLFPQPIPWKAE